MGFLFAFLMASALLATAGTAATVASGASDSKRGSDVDSSISNRETAIDYIASNYGLTKQEAEAFYDQYRGKGSDVDTAWEYLNPKNWFNGWGAKNWDTDWNSLDEEIKYFKNAYDVLGEMPEELTSEELSSLRQQAYDEIDAENQKLLDLYNQTFKNSENVLNKELLENSQMFGDYRNQLLTNEAMRQQALAGSTRFELDRQQRNAITRGASAAQRLVANINTQLGIQAQSAQQALDTSNALAQNLLAHRQAQQGVRSAYLNAQNQYNQNMAGLLSGQAERRLNYGQSKVDAAKFDRDVAYDAWTDKRDDYFRNHSVGAGLYGNGKRSTI